MVSGQDMPPSLIPDSELGREYHPLYPELVTTRLLSMVLSIFPVPLPHTFNGMSLLPSRFSPPLGTLYAQGLEVDTTPAVL